MSLSRRVTGLACWAQRMAAGKAVCMVAAAAGCKVQRHEDQRAALQRPQRVQLRFEPWSYQLPPRQLPELVCTRIAECQPPMSRRKHLLSAFRDVFSLSGRHAVPLTCASRTMAPTTPSLRSGMGSPSLTV